MKNGRIKKVRIYRILLWLGLFSANAFYVHSSFVKYFEEPVIVNVYTRPAMASDQLQITFGKR